MFGENINQDQQQDLKNKEHSRVLEHINKGNCPKCMGGNCLSPLITHNSKEGRFQELHCYHCSFYYFPNSLQYEVHIHEDKLEHILEEELALDDVLEQDINKLLDMNNDLMV